MLPSFLVFLAAALAPGELSPEAAEYNAKAMRFYDAGRLAPAVDEFHAAYQSMPDAHRDLAGREQLLGSMRATLLALHAESGETSPLCRLQSILRRHIDALAAAFPDEPDKLETRSARARHREVTQQLASFGPDVCEPPPPLLTAAVTPVPPAERPAPAPPAPPVHEPAPRRLQIAGAVLLPLGLVALGAVGAVASSYRRHLVQADALNDELVSRAPAEADRARMRAILDSTRQQEGLMISLGVTGSVLVAVGTALLVRRGPQRRRARLGLDLRHKLVGLTISGSF